MLRGHVGPGVASRLTCGRCGVEAPHFLASQRVVRRNGAFRPNILDARAVGEDLPVGNEDAARGLAALINLRFPTHFTGLGVERE